MDALDLTRFRILIVDDNPKNIQILGSFLSQEGFQTAFAQSGMKAMEMVRTNPFDLILLDIMMPEMDGFEVLTALKESPKTSAIPVIFLTAKTDTESIVKGFETGACDYITKPFISRELLARVKSQLQMKALTDDIKRQYEQIRELEEMKEALTHMIVHDLKNPLGIISVYAQLLQGHQALKEEPKAQKHVGAILNSSNTMMQIIMGILDVSRLESNQMRIVPNAVSLADFMQSVENEMAPLLRQASLKMKVAVSTEAQTVFADPDLLNRVLQNLIGNAVHYAPQHSEICISVQSEKDVCRFEVADQGPGIPEKYQNHIFEKFKQMDAKGRKKKYATGLGLTFCKMAVEAMGGAIGVISQEEKGSAFWFTLPKS